MLAQPAIVFAERSQSLQIVRHRFDLALMLLGFAQSDRSPAARLTNPRTAVRISTEGLSCQLGDILDLSESGMRIRTIGRPRLDRGSRFKFTVASSMQRLAVTGQVVWIRRGLFKGMIGIRFVDAPPALCKALVELARHGFVDATCKVNSAASEHVADHGTEVGSARVRADVELEDLYGALGVLPSATTEEIHAAFRTLARQLHPDVNPSEDAAQRFAFVAKAYGVLKDPARRIRYDEGRRAAA
ncbi:MAG: DnaJ domain-containing protein [Phycisphaeraceae bacterium]|nr:DnaJ domain-containing protein [Phycisphaeraceae bacterium]